MFQKGLAKAIVLSSLLEHALRGNLRSPNVGGSWIALPWSLDEQIANVLTDDTTCATWPKSRHSGQVALGSFCCQQSNALTDEEA